MNRPGASFFLTVFITATLFLFPRIAVSQTYLLQENFEGSFPPAGWSVYTPTGNYAGGWTQGPSAPLLLGVCVPQGSKTMCNQWASFAPNNTWAFTPGQVLMTGVTYFIAFQECVQSPSNNKMESLRITIGTSPTDTAQTTTLLNLPALTNSVTAMYTASFTPASSGVYYFAFNSYSAQDQGFLSVDSVGIYKVNSVPFPNPYCSVQFPIATEAITLVNFAGINHTSSNSTASPVHEDLTVLTGTVQTNHTYSITVKGSTNGNYTSTVKAYFDWNQNNNFNDPGESYALGTITNSTGLDAIQLLSSVQVPSWATLGITRMRVVKKHASVQVNACNSDSSGQAEDYTLMVNGITGIDVQVQSGASALIAASSGTLGMTSQIMPSSMNQTVTWSIVPDGSGGDAAIDNNGVVTAIQNGTVYAKATSVADTTMSDSLQITISNQIGTAIANYSNHPDLKVYPNPVQEQLALYTPNAHPELKIVLIDVSGKKIYQADLPANGLNTPVSISTRGLAPGIYRLSIQGEGWYHSQNLVRQ